MQIEANLAKKSLQQRLNSSKKSSSNNKPSSVTTNQITITPKIVKIEKKKEDFVTNDQTTITLNDDKSTPKPLLTTTSPPPINQTMNNQIKTVNLNQTKLIELSHDSIKQDVESNDYPELKNINIKTHQSSKQNKDLNPIKKESNNLKRKSTNSKKPIVQRPNIVRIKTLESENTKYETTFSNIKSDLINKSIKQKYQKPPTKKLKTEQHPTNEVVNNSFTLPTIISPKSNTLINNKDEGSKMIQQTNGNRINLPTNVILNSANGQFNGPCPLILCK